MSSRQESIERDDSRTIPTRVVFDVATTTPMTLEEKKEEATKIVRIMQHINPNESGPILRFFFKENFQIPVRVRLTKIYEKSVSSLIGRKDFTGTLSSGNASHFGMMPHVIQEGLLARTSSRL